MNGDLFRLARHAIAPLVAYAVARGWIPAAAESEVVRFLALSAAIGLAWGVSKYRDVIQGRR